MKKNLSPKKQRFIDFIRNFTEQHHFPPTFAELMEGLHIQSLGTINWYVRELEKEGVLKRSRGHNGKRALSLVEQSEEELMLPLLGSIAAGYPLEAVQVPESIEVPPSYIHPDNYVLRVKGESMVGDNIQDGDYAIIRQRQEVAAGKIVVAYVNGEATLKRYYPKDNHIELHPQNPDFDIIRVNPEDNFRIGGELLCVFRKYE